MGFEAKQLCRQWSLAAALDKGLVLPKVSNELSHVRFKFRRLESRAFGMLQTAVPQIIRDELLASRSMHCVGLIYQVLKVFCPGGLQESPGVDRADSSGDGQNGIRCCGCTSGLD